MPDALVVEKISLFSKYNAFVCDCFKSIKAWKIVDLGFLNHKHGIHKLLKHLESKEEKLLHYIHKKEVLLIKCTSKADLFSKSNSKL